jgi:hypothetical protein
MSLEVEGVIAVMTKHSWKFELVINLGTYLTCSDLMINVVSGMQCHDMGGLNTSLQGLAAD